MAETLELYGGPGDGERIAHGEPIPLWYLLRVRGEDGELICEATYAARRIDEGPEVAPGMNGRCTLEINADGCLIFDYSPNLDHSTPTE